MKDEELLYKVSEMANGMHFNARFLILTLVERYKAVKEDASFLKIQSNGYRNKAQTQKGELARLYKQVAEQKAEIERLQAVVDAELDTIHKLGDDYERALEEQELVKTTKAEAIKEYAWRFEKKIETSPYMSVALKYTMLKNTRQIKDNLVKEMVGDVE